MANSKDLSEQLRLANETYEKSRKLFSGTVKAVTKILAQAKLPKGKTIGDAFCFSWCGKEYSLNHDFFREGNTARDGRTKLSIGPVSVGFDQSGKCTTGHELSANDHEHIAEHLLREALAPKPKHLLRPKVGEQAE